MNGPWFLSTDRVGGRRERGKEFRRALALQQALRSCVRCYSPTYKKSHPCACNEYSPVSPLVRRSTFPWATAHHPHEKQHACVRTWARKGRGLGCHTRLVNFGFVGLVWQRYHQSLLILSQPNLLLPPRTCACVNTSWPEKPSQVGMAG